MRIRREVVPFILGALALSASAFAVCLWRGVSVVSSLTLCVLPCGVLAGYFLYFFRDPHRERPGDRFVAVAGADGVVARIGEVGREETLGSDAVRISIFLSLFDVHVNRAPISGKSTFLGYFPGKRFFTFSEKSSEYNQHNSILIKGLTRCLIRQIVGPVCRRVVYWGDHDKDTEVKAGDRIGMMKFGSRLDMYFPSGEVTVVVGRGDRVRAGETVIARIKGGAES